MKEIFNPAKILWCLLLIFPGIASGGAFDNPAEVPWGFAWRTSVLRPFGLKALERAEVGVAWRGWAVGVRRFGDARYRESQIAVAQALSPRKDLRVGLRLRAVEVQLRGFGERWAFCVDGGLSGALSEAWTLGLSVDNPLGARMGRERLPQVLRMEVAYRPGDVTLRAGVEKEVRFPPLFWAVAAYPIVRRFWLSSGASGQEVWVGMGFSIEQFFLVYRAGYHPALGISQGFFIGSGYAIEEGRDIRL